MSISGIPFAGPGHNTRQFKQAHFRRRTDGSRAADFWGFDMAPNDPSILSAPVSRNERAATQRKTMETEKILEKHWLRT